MRTEDRDQFVALLTDAMAYYGKTASPYVLSVWWAACEQYTLDQVRTALTRHAMHADSGQFAPKVADIVRVLEGTTDDKAAIAWGKAIYAAQRIGAYSDVVFDDPAIHAAIEDIGGWPKFCRAPTKDLSYMQHQFCESHRAYASRGQYEYPRKLIGDRSSDDAYRMHGLEIPKPCVVGDKAAARIVYKHGVAGGKIPAIANLWRLVATRIDSAEHDAKGQKSGLQAEIVP
jgi:hypothetical protein